MSRVTLPPGKKPLATIRRVRDAADRVEDYGKLLEWLLVTNLPKPPSDKEKPFLGEYVQHYADKFPSLFEVNRSLGILNRIKHTNPDIDPPDANEIERAAKSFDVAIMHLLLRMPWPVQRAVFVDPYVQAAKQIGIVALILIAAYVVLSLTVSSLKKHTDRSGSNSRPSTEEVAKKQTETIEHAAYNARSSIERLEGSLAKWNQRWAEIAANDEGRRLAGSTESVRAIAGLAEQKRPNADEIRAMRADIEQALQPLQESQGNRDYTQTDFGTVVALCDRIQRRAREAVAECSSALETVDRLLAKAPSAPLASKTLAQAIKDLHEADRAAKVEAERKAAQAAALARAAREALISARTAAYQKKLEEKRTEFKRLHTLAQDETIRAKFEPFLASGTRVPYRDRNGVRWQNEHGRTAGPATAMRYDWLIQARVFESVEDMIAVGTHAGNDRPKWSPPKSESERQEFVDRFELLKQVAPMWHDMGLLGPPPERPRLPDPDLVAEALKPFQGEWRQRKYDFDVAIVGDVGVMTRGSKPDHHVGEDALRIESVSGATFTGTHFWSDGSWEPVTGELSTPNLIRLNSASLQWTMERL